MRRAALAPLFALLGCSGTGYSQKDLRIDVPLPVTGRFTPGVSRYGDFLAQLGPPAVVAELEARGEFAFLYDHLDVREWRARLSYSSAQVSYSRGGGRQEALLVYFDAGGRLQHVAPVARKLYLGWGGTAGHSYIPELFFNFRDYLSEDTQRGRFGAVLLDPHGRRFVVDHGRGFLYQPGQAVGFGGN